MFGDTGNVDSVIKHPNSGPCEKMVQTDVFMVLPLGLMNT